MLFGYARAKTFSVLSIIKIDLVILGSFLYLEYLNMGYKIKTLKVDIFKSGGWLYTLSLE